MSLHAISVLDMVQIFQVSSLFYYEAREKIAPQKHH